MSTTIGGDVFEVDCDPIEVTSLHRPDPTWVFVDAHGHEHRWFTNGHPATRYCAGETYEVPSLVWVKDGEEYWEDDDEPHPLGLECRQCGEHITPRSTADTNRVYVPGLMRYSINGESVTREEFERRFNDAKAKL